MHILYKKYTLIARGALQITQGGAKMKQVVIPVIFLLLFSGCGGESEQNIEPKVEIELAVKDSFGQEENTFIQGEDIEFTLTLTNNTPNYYTLHYARQLRLRVTTVLDIEIHDSSDGIQVQGGTKILVAPNETVVRSASWNQKLFNGETLPPGEYTAYVSFRAHIIEKKQSITVL